MIIYVVAISFLGIYVASFLLIGYFMRRHGKYGWLATAAISIGVPLVFFIVFERWFLVPLAEGSARAAARLLRRRLLPRRKIMEEINNLAARLRASR